MTFTFDPVTLTTSQGCVDPISPNLAETWQSFKHKKFVSAFVAISNASGSNLSNVENDAKFRTFVGEISIPIIVEALQCHRTSGIHLMAIHCAAAVRGVMIKK